jgi:hypothetical protein
VGIERTPHGCPDKHADCPAVRRRRSPLAVALVAGTALIAGSGGAYWAASAQTGGAHGSPVGDDADFSGKAGAPPPLALDGWTGAGTAAGSGGPAYRTTGALPTGPESAHVYRAVDQVPRTDVARLAAALGVPGPVRLDGGMWRAGAVPGTSGPALEVNQDAPGSWVFARYGTAPPCKLRTGVPASGTAVCYAAEGTGSSETRAASAASPASPDEAKRAAAPVLAAVGLVGRPADATQTAGPNRTIVVDPVYGGLPTHGWRTTLQVASDGGLLSATGRLARVTEGAAYPVVGARRALQEMQVPGSRVPAACPTSHPGASTDAGASTGSTGVNPGGLMVRRSSSASGLANPVDRQRTPMGPCVPGWAAQPLEVHGATFGLSAQFVSGRPELVPSWLFQVTRAGGGRAYTVAQPAVDPRFLTAPGEKNPGLPTAPLPSPSGSPTVANTRIDSYAANGRTLTLRFYGGLCERYSASVVRQSTGSVAVRITGVVKNPRRTCPMIAKQFIERVILSQRLDARPVYDASDGHHVAQRS